MKTSLISAMALAAVLSFSSASLCLAEGGVNVNTATQEQLAAVPGLNADLAKAIIQYREEMGDIQNIDELADVPGMSKDILNKAKDGGLQVEAISGAECNC